jgi:hypothetical protein
MDFGPGHNLPAWLRAAAFMLFASIAGALGYTMRMMDSDRKISKARLLVEFLSSGLVGLFVMWLCNIQGVSFEVTAISVGVSGWLGASASIQIIQRFVWRNLKLNRSDDDVD